MEWRGNVALIRISTWINTIQISGHLEITDFAAI